MDVLIPAPFKSKKPLVKKIHKRLLIKEAE
jgi:hypothetical protein